MRVSCGVLVFAAAAFAQGDWHVALVEKPSLLIEFPRDTAFQQCVALETVMHVSSWAPSDHSHTCRCVANNL